MRSSAIGWALLTVLVSIQASAQEPAQNAIQGMVEDMAGPGIMQVGGHRILTEGILQPFYTNRDFMPAWEQDDRIE